MDRRMVELLKTIEDAYEEDGFFDEQDVVDFVMNAYEIGRDEEDD